MAGVFDWIWNEKFWLPPNMTWKDLERTPENPQLHTSASDLWYTFLIAVFFLMLRFLLERFCFVPLGVWLGIESKRRGQIPSPNKLLEKAYGISKKPKQDVIDKLAGQLEWSERQVQRWLRMRRKQDTETEFTKFCESCWKFVYYGASLIAGTIIIWNKPYVWNIREEFFADFPHEIVPSDVWWYQMCTIAVYMSFMVTHFFDARRKDFYQMMMHHILSILMTSLSFVVNMTRFATFTVFLHDWADCFLEAAKLSKYAKYHKTCDVLFGIFTIVWVISRVICVPFFLVFFADNVILKTGTWTVKNDELFQFGCYRFLISMLYALQVIQFIWTYMIFKLLIKVLRKGNTSEVSDIRSENSSLSSNGDSDVERKKQ